MGHPRLLPKWSAPSCFYTRHEGTRGSEGIAPLILNFGSQSWRLVSLTHLPLYSRYPWNRNTDRWGRWITCRMWHAIWPRCSSTDICTVMEHGMAINCIYEYTAGRKCLSGRSDAGFSTLETRSKPPQFDLRPVEGASFYWGSVNISSFGLVTNHVFQFI